MYFLEGTIYVYVSYLVYTVIKESKACILIADKRALFDETNEHLSLGHEGVKLLMGSITTLQKACKKSHIESQGHQVRDMSLQ